MVRYTFALAATALCALLGAVEVPVPETAPVPEPVETPVPLDTSMVKCCDGWVSGCACDGPHGGCCSHHNGICGCT